MSIGDAFAPRKFQTPRDKMARKTAGKRSRTRTERKRGRYIRSREMRGLRRDSRLPIMSAIPLEGERDAREHPEPALMG